MKLACYADDAREPDLIGEGLVDLTEVVTKGESDGAWFFVTHVYSFVNRLYQNGIPLPTRTGLRAKFTLK